MACTSCTPSQELRSPAREVVMSRLVGALHAQGELARLGRPLVHAGEVMDEGFGEVNPTVDATGLQTVQPCPGCALEHERNVFYSDTLVAVQTLRWTYKTEKNYGKPEYS